jgi:hypothetical protein
MRTRKITLTVYCLEEDEQTVKDSLMHWFNFNDCPLSSIETAVNLPTEEEDIRVCENLDIER